jgi:hypothetical protein
MAFSSRHYRKTLAVKKTKNIVLSQKKADPERT